VMQQWKRSRRDVALKHNTHHADIDMWC
jgi:hypothetical protein